MFLLKIKIKQNPGCPNKEDNAILGRIQAKLDGLQVLFVPKTVVQSQGREGGVQPQKYFVIFTQNCNTKLLYKYKDSFFLKTGNLIIDCVQLYPTDRFCRKHYPHKA